MARTFKHCCVCGKSADAAVMKPAEPLRGIALLLRLTLISPKLEYLHEKCERRLQALVNLRNETIRLERARQNREDDWSMRP